MSLSLLLGYSSAEEEQEAIHDGFQHRDSSDDDDDGDHDDAAQLTADAHPSLRDRSIFEQPHPSASGLPSAFDVFSEVSGPPEFLNNSVEEYNPVRDIDTQQGRQGNRRNRRDKKDLPAGVVVESKPQLVGIHERVRSDIDGGQAPTSATSGSADGGKRVVTATNPNPEDAAELLRMCLQCGVPKTFSNVRGMVCPICGDRPASETSNVAKNKGSTIKDKEKSKRMRGQSSHATWKSETEMQLRQQFD